MDSTNPMTAVKDPHTNAYDIKSDTGSEVGNATNSVSPTTKEPPQANSHPNENGKEKEKDESNL